MSGGARRLVRAGAFVAMFAALAMPATSGGRVLRAESVMPPGQSGYVSITGVISGTGSPHLTDQIQPFTNFAYKDATIGQHGATERPRVGVRIVRDSFGVPAIYGDSAYNAWWGVGYAIAQDRLFQLELFRRAASGRLSEILGSTYLDDDLISRRDYYTDDEVAAMLTQLPPRLHDRFEAYRDGINAWIQHVTLAPTQIPGEFVALLDLPIAPWTLIDSARVGILLARTVPNGDGAELDNARALRKIGAGAFDRMLPLQPPGTQFTVPRSAGEFPSLPGRRREHRALRRSTLYLDQVPLPAANGSPGLSKSSASPLDGLVRGFGGSSFMYAMRDVARGRAYLYNGPQLGFSIPEMLVEFEVHQPGAPPVRGVSAAGVPVVGIGHNNHVAWGFTSGESDTNDLYVEKLAGHERYRFNGRTRRMDCRDETFTWRTPPTSLPDLISDPGLPAGSRTERICRTVHGPVQASARGYAFARRYNVWRREIESLGEIAAINSARSVADVDRAVRRATWNENVMAADDRGHIGFWHPGLLPLRSSRWDERLPLPGQGQAEWRGFLDRRTQIPRVIDPPQSWLANWNNFPSAGWTSGDSESRGRLTGRFHRVRLIERLVAKAILHPSYAALKDVVRVSGTTVQARPFAGPMLRAAIRRAHGKAREALKAVRAWDGNYTDTEGGGLDPGLAIFEELKEQLAGQLIAHFGDGARLLSPAASAFHFYDTTNAEGIAMRILGPRSWARAAAATVDVLSRRFGGTDVSDWRAHRHLYPVPAQGAASSPDLPFFDRGTWEQAVALGP